MANRKEGFTVSKFLRKLSSLGTNYDDMVKSSGGTYTKGRVTDPVSGKTSTEYDLMVDASAMSFTSNIGSTSLRDKSLAERRKKYREYAREDIMDDLLDKVSDEAIVYDEDNLFLKPHFEDSDLLKKNVKQKIEKEMQTEFMKIYNMLGFHDENMGWSFFKKFLIDGAIAFEILYDDIKNPSEIIGFKELDAAKLEPTVDSEGNQVWVIKTSDHTETRPEFKYDSQIIYIPYNNRSLDSHFSYVERLIRPFNMYHIMRKTRVIWAVMSSQQRTKFIIPTAGKSKNRARESLRKLMHNYNEQVHFNDESGQVSVDGQTNFPFRKQVFVPETSAGTPKVEDLPNNPVDLSDTDQLQEFRKELILVSKIPTSRFDLQEAKGDPSWNISAEEATRSEIQFSRFINRLRTIYQALIVKPLWISLTMKFEELEGDENLKTLLKVRFNRYNMFEELKNLEVMKKKAEVIGDLQKKLAEAENPREEPFFDLKFLIQKHMNDFFTDEDIKKSEEMKKERGGGDDEGGGSAF